MQFILIMIFVMQFAILALISRLRVDIKMAAMFADDYNDRSTDSDDVSYEYDDFEGLEADIDDDEEMPQPQSDTPHEFWAPVDGPIEVRIYSDDYHVARQYTPKCWRNFNP